MARIRSIKPTLWRDEKLTLLNRDARLTFLGLISFADDEGRLQGDLRLVKSDIYPLDDGISLPVLEAQLVALAEAGLILRYTVKQSHAISHYIQLPNWRKHQAINKPRKSEFPPPPAPLQDGSGNLPTPKHHPKPDGDGSPTVALREDDGSATVGLPWGMEWNGREEEWKGTSQSATSADAPTPDGPPDPNEDPNGFVGFHASDSRLAARFDERSFDLRVEQARVIIAVWSHFGASDAIKRDTLLAEMLSAPDGMHGPPTSWDMVIANAREYLTNNATPNLRLFRGYLYRDRAALSKSKSTAVTKRGAAASSGESFTEARTRRAAEGARAVWQAQHAPLSTPTPKLLP